MRLFLGSDVHVDYAENLRWLENLSHSDYTDDVLILAGDISDEMPLIERVLKALRQRFRTVLFVPGNHDLWTARSGKGPSFAKFEAILDLCRNEGIETGARAFGRTLIVPLYSWYDYSFGEPGAQLKRGWMDFYKCNWEGMDMAAVTRRFDALNVAPDTSGFDRIVSFSHFLPRIDIMPARYPEKYRALFPVFGSDTLETRIRALGSTIHCYGHSHLNREIEKEGVTYINNAFGYPDEKEITRKGLHQILAL